MGQLDKQETVGIADNGGNELQKYQGAHESSIAAAFA